MGRWTEGSPSAEKVRRIVAAGYDEMGERFDRWADAMRGSPRDAFVLRLFEEVPPGVAVLEIGCGSGARSTGALARRYHLTGIDLSAHQVERARERLPWARFLVGDVTRIELSPASFRAIVAYYVMNHIPCREHAGVYRQVATWLQPGRVFITNLPVSGGGDGVEDPWLGVPMFFASLDAKENLRLIRAAGLEVVDAVVISEIEADPDDESSTEQGEWQWVVARRQGTVAGDE
jgi:SAM-dependent methyltransferase